MNVRSLYWSYMKKTISGIVLVASLALCACAKSGAQNTPTPAAPDTNPTVAPTKTTVYYINGMTVEDFYRQFQFQLTRACGQGAVIYRFPISNDLKIAVNAKGQDVLVNLSLLMNADNTYEAAYQEIEVLAYTDDGFRYRVSREKVVQGQWHINEDQLVLDALGVASAMTENGQPVMVLRMMYDIMTNGLKGATLTLSNADADYVPVPSADPCR